MESLKFGLPIFWALCVLIAMVARLRLPERSPAWTWAVSLPIAMLPITLAWGGVALLSTGVALGLVLVGLGLVFLAIWVVMTRRSIVKVQAARTDGQVAAALDEPLVEMSLVWAGAMLLIGLVAVVAILAWALVARGG